LFLRKNLGGMAESVRVATIRQAYAAFNNGDLNAVLDLMDEQVEWRPATSSLEPQPLHGRAAVREHLSPEQFEEQTAEPQEVIEKGNRILIVARVRARGRASGIEIEQTVFHVLTIADERVVRFELHAEREQALAALQGQAG
jgi:ketosteroid isomerase-like protein